MRGIYRSSIWKTVPWCDRVFVNCQRAVFFVYQIIVSGGGFVKVLPLPEIRAGMCCHRLLMLRTLRIVKTQVEFVHLQNLKSVRWRADLDTFSLCCDLHLLPIDWVQRSGNVWLLCFFTLASWCHFFVVSHFLSWLVLRRRRIGLFRRSFFSGTLHSVEQDYHYAWSAFLWLDLDPLSDHHSLP